MKNKVLFGYIVGVILTAIILTYKKHIITVSKPVNPEITVKCVDNKCDTLYVYKFE